MTACLMVGAVAMTLAQPLFTLSWTHSVERTEWRETWGISAGALQLRHAAVRGSGAGMEPGEGVRLRDGWWEWAPDLTVPDLRLAASGATGAGWTLCFDGTCHQIAELAGAGITLAPCPDTGR